MTQVFISGDGDFTGEVTEGTGVNATGTLESIEFVGPPGFFFAPVDANWIVVDPPDFGTVTLSGSPGDTIVWTYDLDDTNPAVQDLVLGETLLDTFVIEASALTGDLDPDAREVTITIFGVCFANGTLIETDTGLVAVEDLQPGQRVMTRDAGPQPIVWLGGGSCPEDAWRKDSHLLPVRIRAGALGEGRPAQDLFVSQNHRMLISGARAELFFGEDEVLIAAKYLCGLPGVDVIQPSGGLSYHHILCAAHHILMANGCPAESMLVSDEALLALAPDDLMALETRLREVRSVSGDARGRACRRVLSRFESRLMVQDVPVAPDAIAA